ncbi:DUF5005 domain-containing protein [Chitinophaga cymbidii]|uniref:DUF5005 domain-containing protein n=1 Tax=Chitinophaga cymbidii TaxID=1096750 RepID=A0A512REX7_9BACT|nr:DUF5005 domain-containing protein [Chitinophaga cymbidii]GEP94270.1 hypothetical protein CCY01nite_05300 [Chitinophaga cymbidii]
MNKMISLLIVGSIFTSCMKNPLDGYLSQERAIISFRLAEGQVGEAEIVNGPDSAIITVWAEKDLDLSAISPVVTVSKGAAVLPAKNVKVDFASKGNRYTYRVTSEAGIVKNWYVRIMKESEQLAGPRLQLLQGNGKWDPRVTVYSDLDYNGYLTRYQNWNGGDGCYSVLLPDGRIVWSFQDSFFGQVSANRSRTDNVMLRNAAHIQLDTSLQSFIPLNPGLGNQSETWIKYGDSPEDQHWYWPGAGQIHDNKFQMLLSHVTKTGSGSWDFAHVSTDIAIFDLPSMQLNQIIKDKDVVNNYSAGSMKAPDGYTYMYATETGYLTTFMYVARVAGHDLTGAWEYYGENGWVSTPQKYNVCNNITQPNVFYKNGKYYLVSQQHIFGLDIYIQESATPVGPWTNKRTLYRIPEQYTGDIITYNAFVHHALSREGELVISYNINPTDFNSNFNAPGSADRYRPFFVRVFNWQ